jgi:hydroxymethylglutaryl-CoA lyase
MGHRTGIDLAALLKVRHQVEEALGSVPMFGGLARSGLPVGYSKPLFIATNSANYRTGEST